mgnify:FL=1
MLAPTNINPTNICFECEADTFPVRWHGGDSHRADRSEIMEICFCECHDEGEEEENQYPAYGAGELFFLEDWGFGEGI